MNSSTRSSLSYLFRICTNPGPLGIRRDAVADEAQARRAPARSPCPPRRTGQSSRSVSSRQHTQARTPAYLLHAMSRRARCGDRAELADAGEHDDGHPDGVSRANVVTQFGHTCSIVQDPHVPDAFRARPWNRPSGTPLWTVRRTTPVVISSDHFMEPETSVDLR